VTQRVTRQGTGQFRQLHPGRSHVERELRRRIGRRDTGGRLADICCLRCYITGLEWRRPVCRIESDRFRLQNLLEHTVFRREWTKLGNRDR
jgi:hypothetical protein